MRQASPYPKPDLVPAGGALFDVSHLDNPYRPVAVILIMALLILAATTLWLHHGVFGEGMDIEAMAAYCWLYLAITVVAFLGKLLRKGPRNWLTPDVVFWLIYTLFHIPYALFYVLEWVKFDNRVFYDPGSVNRSLVVVNLCGLGFLIGYELGPLGRSSKARFQPARRMAGGAFQTMQMCLLIATVLAVLATAVFLGKALITGGYHGLMFASDFGVSGRAQKWAGLARMGLRSSILIFVVACLLRHHKVFKGYVLPTIIVSVLSFYMLLGARSGSLQLAAPIILGYHYFIRRIPIWLGAVLLVMGLVLSAVIGAGRASASISPWEIYGAYSELTSENELNPALMTLAEGGASLKCVNIACAFIPHTEPYWMGQSVLSSFFMIIPSPVEGLRVSRMAPSGWATIRATGKSASTETAGWGSSIAMEAYMNFGIIGGAVFMVTVGWIFRRIYDAAIYKPTFMRLVLLLISLSCLVTWVRNYSHHFIRPVAWTLMGAWLLWAVAGGGKSAQSTSPRSGGKLPGPTR